MRKWSPEPLAAGKAAAHFVAEWSGLMSALSPTANPTGRPAERIAFSPLYDASGAVEREPAAVAEDEDAERNASAAELAAEIAAQEEALAATYAEKLAAYAAEREVAEQRWRDEFATRIAAERERTLHDLARETGQLAVQLAEKIVRATIAHDEAVLIRAIETVLHKVDASTVLVVTAHPDDAKRLAADQALRARLRIAAVKEDRRVERGGCLVAADRQEWDATIAKQLATLAEKVDEALAGGTATNRAEQHEPAGVE